jgi:NitT/TauT family transport system permease protein
VVGRNLLTGDYMLKALWVTTQEVLLGFIIAVVFGFALGVLVGETSFGERAVMPYLVAVNTMPKVAFAPLFVSWLGFGIASKVALAAFIAFFPVIVGTAAGLHAADQNARMLFKTMGASRWQTLMQLKLPIGMPHFFAGLKNAAVLTVVGAVVGEFLGGGKGFGELIRVAAAQLDTPRVFSLIIYLSLLGLATFWVVAWAQRRFVFWHKETVTEETLGQ